MKSILKSESKLLYAALASLPALFSYLAILVYEYSRAFTILADITLITSVVLITASLAIVWTKIGIAFWLRRWRFAIARLATVLISGLASALTCLYLVFF